MKEIITILAPHAGEIIASIGTGITAAIIRAFEKRKMRKKSQAEKDNQPTTENK